MTFLFSSIIAPIVVGCAIAYYKNMLENRRNKK
ncbi:type I toxin-antitoxin system Fst family toxin [Listeria booriae]|nr:type I toxin-antitoxin system Fst family toxin [Listeria booriae]MBC1514287.1 type I toxin-antitoxin system Fst family toxin [Listeria booriae]MBC1563643.1 type I toxin-antitoxin system Fst family toxin [Listeria booriae]MBC2057929.1 type I toxin-antitoxin system Fst family toxin [Listeria booriae]MBC2178158.1 type I toxin-antitoxin system Fst family toxin [Listeria booriae]MBC2178315.1 type I toxin-antitoxin system Fst family toxin [Listeria booriae]